VRSVPQTGALPACSLVGLAGPQWDIIWQCLIFTGLARKGGQNKREGLFWKGLFMKVFWLVFFLCIFLCNIQAVVISDPNLSLSQMQQEEISDLYEILLAVYDNNITLIPTEPNELLALETSEDSRDVLAREIIKMIRGVWDPNSEYFDDNSSIIFDEKCVSDESLNSVSDVTVEMLNEMSTVNISATTLSDQGQEIVSTQFTGPVEELSNPLGSRILESKTYRITTLPLEIEGHVVFPAGAKLIAPYDPNSNIIEVMPGGLLDMGKAVNISDPNFPDVLPPVEILPEDPNFYFTHNNVGIYIRRGADPCTRIYNTIVTHCRIGIVADEALTSPIQNVITFGCYDGIYIFATNSILDSEFWLYGAVSEGFYNYIGAGIYINLDGGGYPYPSAEISRTATYGGDVGIFMEGCDLDPNLADPNQTLPKVKVINSILSSSYFYGIYKTQADAQVDLSYCAFWDNYYHSNIELLFTGCVGLSYDPFYVQGEDRRLFIDPGSEAIDAGYGMAEDGMGTCDYLPDHGPMDIGCHFPVGVTGSFGIPASPADFNWDGIVDDWDLELMDWCMGATGDPNIVKFDTSYDSQVNLPDFGLMSFDYGYSYDPNESNNNDPNCERSDFNGDHRVDLEDVRVLADYWLTKVFDPYRICSLCNLYRNPDPNEPEIDEIIDSRDYDAFMAEWGKEGCVDPNIIIEQSASKVTIGIGNTDMAWKISVFLDNEPIGQWISGESGEPVFDVDLMRYGPGGHNIRIVRNIDYGLDVRKLIITDPNSTGLYFADISETFEPNEPYSIRGFNLNTGDLNFRIGNIQGQMVYDTNVPSGVVNLQVPETVFEDGQLFTMAAGKRPHEPGDTDYYEEVLKRKFDPNDWRGKSLRVVVLLPSNRVTKTYKDAIFAAFTAIERRQLSGVVLSGHDVNQDNLNFLFTEMGGRKILIYFGHANSHLGRVFNNN
jgi:hypothetical protein